MQCGTQKPGSKGHRRQGQANAQPKNRAVACSVEQISGPTMVLDRTSQRGKNDRQDRPFRLGIGEMRNSVHYNWYAVRQQRIFIH